MSLRKYKKLVKSLLRNRWKPLLSMPLFLGLFLLFQNTTTLPPDEGEDTRSPSSYFYPDRTLPFQPIGHHYQLGGWIYPNQGTLGAWSPELYKNMGNFINIGSAWFDIKGNVFLNSGQLLPANASPVNGVNISQNAAFWNYA